MFGDAWASDRVIDEVIAQAKGESGSAPAAAPAKTVVIKTAPTAQQKIFGMSPLVLLVAGVGLYFLLRRNGE